VGKQSARLFVARALDALDARRSTRRGSIAKIEP